MPTDRRAQQMRANGLLRRKMERWRRAKFLAAISQKAKAKR